MIEIIGSKAPNKKLKVVFKDGTSICYKNATTTYIEAIRKIGPELFASASLEIGHLPVVSKECFEKYKKYMLPLGNGWWVNNQSDSSEKFLQLLAVKNKLGLEYDVKMADSFEEYDEHHIKHSRLKESIYVIFEDGTCIKDLHNEDIFLKTIEKIGAEKILYKCIEYQDKEIVTRYNKYRKQKQLNSGLWVTIPPSTKDMKKCISHISEKLKMKIETV